MNDKEIIREDLYGWVIAQTADNNVQLLRFEKRFASHDYEAVGIVAQRATSITVKFNQSDWTHISLRAHEITIIISTPTGKWFSAEQEQFAESISDFLGSLI